MNDFELTIKALSIKKNPARFALYFGKRIFWKFIKETENRSRLPINRYLVTSVELVLNFFHSVRQTSPKPAIHQVVPNLEYGDAISNQAIYLRRFIAHLGYSSKILVDRWDFEVSHECEMFNPYRIKSDDILIFHFAIGADVMSHVINHLGTKALVFHNITPPEFFERYSPEMVETLKSGIKSLHSASDLFDYFFGDSEFNVKELARFGVNSATVFPLLIEPSDVFQLPTDSQKKNPEHPTKNIIFVGRVVPNKCQHDLITMFYHLNKQNQDTKLTIIGKINGGSSAYVSEINALIDEHGLKNSVLLTGKVSGDQLIEYYKSADLFISMSEHEGFCVPIIEAMWFDIPVLAYASSAVPETVVDPLCLFDDKSRLQKTAEYANRLLYDQSLRDTIISNQRENRQRFGYVNLKPKYTKVINQLVQGNSTKPIQMNDEIK
jgi:glycosyltransferase involved in cell wall biosynthesis